MASCLADFNDHSGDHTQLVVAFLCGDFKQHLKCSAYLHRSDSILYMYLFFSSSYSLSEFPCIKEYLLFKNTFSLHGGLFCILSQSLLHIPKIYCTVIAEVMQPLAKQIERQPVTEKGFILRNIQQLFTQCLLAEATTFQRSNNELPPAGMQGWCFACQQEGLWSSNPP